MKEVSRKTESIFVEGITVSANARRINDGVVARLMESMEEIGLQHPIKVWQPPGVDRVVLVAGLHRLEAAQRLGWDMIDAVFLDNTDELDRRLVEIAENLDRAELTAQERADQIAEWIEIRKQKASLQSGQLAPIEGKRADGRGHRPEGGTKAAARSLGIEETEAKRSVKIAATSPEAKEAAREAGLDNNQSALLKIAKAPKSEQLAVVHELAERRASKIDRDVKDRAAHAVAELIAEYVPGSAWDALKSNLYAAGANNIANALTNITGEAIMDKK